MPAGALVLLGLALSFTGYLLPWDQLALWAVKVGSRSEGVAWDAAFSGDVRFILIGGTEVTQGTYRLWLVVHAGVLAAAFAAVLAVLARLRR